MMRPLSIDVARNKVLLAQTLGISNPDFRSVIFVILFVGSMGWMMDTILAFLQALVGPDDFKGFWVTTVGILPFFLVLGWGWWRWKDAQKKKYAASAKQAEIEPHQGVVVFLSNLKPEILRRVEEGDDSVEQERFYSWRQVDRGLEPHRERLRLVWVICSAASGLQYEVFQKKYASRYPDVEFRKIGEADGKDFEDISCIVDVLEEIYAGLPSHIDITDVMIDITGGQKTNSVAGVMAVLAEPGREFQYVQTDEPWSVKTYRFASKFMGRGLVEK